MVHMYTHSTCLRLLKLYATVDKDYLNMIGQLPVNYLDIQ